MKSLAVLSLLILLGTYHASIAMAQSPGTFTATGSMMTPREEHTATLLPNGKVLITGGSGGRTVWATAELYDPSTGTFSAGGNMTTERSMHTATLLPNGKVLIAGGSASVTSLASAELYDPSTGNFTATGSMHQARKRHTATLLDSGEVLIAGGELANQITSSSFFLLSAEFYDPFTGAFTVVGFMNMKRFAHTATLLGNGQVLIAGSHPEANDGQGSELYDPPTFTFTLISRAGYGGAETATLLMNGKVLVTSSFEAFPNADLYDPSTGILAPTSEMRTRFRTQYTATLLPDSTILIAGGDPLGEALLYEPASGTFLSTGRLGIFRRWHTATLLPDGAVLIAGGYDTPPVSLNTAQLYKAVVLTPAPWLYSLSGDGRGQGAVLHATTHQLVSSSNPATVGEALEIYGAGLADGSVIPPQVAIGGRTAEVLFFGKAPGIGGLNQVNVRVPSGVVPGPAVSVRLTYLSRPSNEVTIGVQ